MDYLKNINVFFNELRLNAGAMWVVDNNINFSAPKKFQNQETSDFIRGNKEYLISILSKNNIFSIEDFLSCEIVKDHTMTEFPLSPAQERLWFIEQYEDGTNAYHIPKIFELSSETNIEGIKYGLQQIVSRHEILKSTIEQTNHLEYAIQKVREETIQIDEILVDSIQEYQDLIEEDINRPFDLNKEYPIRIKIYRVGTDSDASSVESARTFLMINIHHIATDGWSMDIIQMELMLYYEAYVSKDQTFALPELEIQYKDYALWQRAYLSGEVLEKQMAFWKEKLSNFQTLQLPTDYRRPGKVDYSGNIFSFELEKDLSFKLRKFAKEKDSTLYTLLLAAFYILLHKYSRQNDIVIGTPIANRHYRQTSNLVGFFANTLVIREHVEPTFTIDELLQNLNQNILDCQQNQDLPFEKIVNELQVERDLSRHPVFQVLFRCQSYVKKKEDGLATHLMLQNSSYTYTSKFDLHLSLEDSDDSLTGVIEYATSLFEESSIARLSTHYQVILEQMVGDQELAIKDYSLLGKKETKQIIYDWNSTNRDYQKDETIVDLFQSQVDKNPNRVALAFENQELTYAELNERSNQLAHHLRANYLSKNKRALEANSLIALYLNRNVEMIIGILAVLKAGGAYVPMDTTYPLERINYLLEDTQASIILTQRQLTALNEVQLPGEKVLYIDLEESFYQTQKTQNLKAFSSSQDLAYVIYTSGTTGQPKGVMIEHAAFSQFIQNFDELLTEEYKIEEKSVLSLTNYVFDIFGLEYALPLTTGHQLTLSSVDTLSERDFKDKQIIQQTPSSLWHVASSFSEHLSDKICLVGGEALPSSVAGKLKQSFGKVFNVYGPAETVIWSSIFEVEDPEKPYIGKPLFNEKAYVLDEYQKPVAIGVIGELYIGGASLARGYWNREELTEERFVSNPYADYSDLTNGHTRLYKTGDLVRWLSNGNLEYISRNDDQIKIRGHRVELGEVEQALSKIEGIKQNCVVVKNRETKVGVENFLMAYYILDPNFESENDTEILENWENVYESEYEDYSEEIKIDSDFSIWLSYISGEPIPLQEMEEWRGSIVERIKDLNPKVVLEIGIGSGLLMYPLLEEVERFVGLDISQSAINRHETYLQDKSWNADLCYLRADQIDQLDFDENYDTIILNSVCQYFPSINYFEEVLDKAINRLPDNGTIFLGDLRNYDLHKDLIKEKLEYEGKEYTMQDLERIALKENELLISPKYFKTLKSKYKKLKFEVMPRNGKYVNELSKYRYDVVLSFKAEKLNSFSQNGTHSKPKAEEVKKSDLCNTPFLNQLRKEDIYNQLLQTIPSYMIPANFMALESFPRTVNGKLDKRALPDPDFNEAAEKYVEPTTEEEIAMCEIWQRVLGLERVGINDNFFRIGGSSILAIQVSHQVSKILGYEMRVADMFSFPSIHQFLSNQVPNNIEYEEGEL